MGRLAQRPRPPDAARPHECVQRGLRPGLLLLPRGVGGRRELRGREGLGRARGLFLGFEDVPRMPHCRDEVLHGDVVLVVEVDELEDVGRAVGLLLGHQLPEAVLELLLGQVPPAPREGPGERGPQDARPGLRPPGGLLLLLLRLQPGGERQEQLHVVDAVRREGHARGVRPDPGLLPPLEPGEEGDRGLARVLHLHAPLRRPVGRVLEGRGRDYQPLPQALGAGLELEELGQEDVAGPGERHLVVVREAHEELLPLRRGGLHHGPRVDAEAVAELEVLHPA
mmetsp:Transcript_41962/g.118664  ORF Transcript_41962/g.118664 Transcript_41962/m.118664 type:complete len:282 (-) Transcript_41962:786-1631(-)